MPPPFSPEPAASVAAPVKHVVRVAAVGAVAAVPVHLETAASQAFARPAVVRVSRVVRGPERLFAKPDSLVAVM